MKILISGYKYLLSNIKSNDGDKDINTLKFYNEKGVDKDEIVGTSNQEVLRALIDRVKYLDNELPHSFNKEIIFHLRKALALHEARHLTRMVDKDVVVEEFPVGNNGHFICLDKEKEYFYQDEIVQNDLAKYSGSTLTDAEKEFAKGLTAKINTTTSGATSLLFPQDEMTKHCTRILRNNKYLSKAKAAPFKNPIHMDNIIDDTFETIEKIKEVEEYEKKKLFLDPEEDRLVMDNKDIPTITEVAYNKNNLDTILADNSIEKIYIEKEGTTLQLEFAKAMAFELPKKITNIGIGGYFRVNTINITIDDTLMELVFLSENNTSKTVCISKYIDTILFHTLYDFIKTLISVDGVNSEHKSFRFLGGDITIDSYDALIERTKDLIAGQNDKLLLETMLDNFAAKLFQIHNDCLDGDIKPIDRIVFNITLHTKVEDIETLQPKEELNTLDNKLPQDKYFIYVGKRNMLLQKLLAIPFVSNNNILDVTNVIFDHFVYIPNSLLIKKLFKGNLVNIQEIKVELVKQELNSNVKDLINSSIGCNKHCDSAILVEYNVNTNTIIDKSTGKPTYKKEKVNSTYFFIFYIKYNNHKG